MVHITVLLYYEIYVLKSGRTPPPFLVWIQNVDLQTLQAMLAQHLEIAF